ncbi:MAG: thiamine-binding protein [Acidimicrobiales bacterium]
MLAAFSVTPLGTDESVGELVANAVRVARQSGLPNETNAMFTNLEGEWDEVMGTIRASIDKVAEGSPRVSVLIKLDYRPGAATGRLTRDVESVERRLR